MDELRFELQLGTTPDAVYDLLLDGARFAAATGKPAEIEPLVGSAFTCFGGAITGRQVELVRPTRIVQVWRARNWEPGDHSLVRFELLADGPSHTRLLVTQWGAPAAHRAHLQEGWPRNYGQALRGAFG